MTVLTFGATLSYAHSMRHPFRFSVEVRAVPAQDAVLAVEEKRHGQSKHLLYAEGRFWLAIRSLAIPQDQWRDDGLSTILRHLEVDIRSVGSRQADAEPFVELDRIPGHLREVIAAARAKIEGSLITVGRNLYVETREPVATLHIERDNFLNVSVSASEDHRYGPTAFESYARTSFPLSDLEALGEFRRSLVGRRAEPEPFDIDAPFPDIFKDDLDRFAGGTSKWLLGALPRSQIGWEDRAFLNAYRRMVLGRGAPLVNLTDLLISCTEPDAPVHPASRSGSPRVDISLTPAQNAGVMLALANARLRFQAPELFERHDDDLLDDISI